MEDMMESVKPITGKAERENEVERLKKKFNFVKSGSSSFFPNSAKNPPVKATIANSINYSNLTTINSAKGKSKGKGKSPVKVTYPKARERSSSGVKFSSSRPVNINNVVNIVNNNYNNIVTSPLPKGTAKPIKITTINKISENNDTSKRSQSSVKSSNRHVANKHLNRSIENSITSGKSDADVTERRSDKNSQLGHNFMNRDNFLREVINNISKNDSFDCKAYYFTDTSGLKNIEATKLGHSLFNEDPLQNSNNLHVSNFPDEQMINNYGISYLENKKDYSSFFSKKKIFELEEDDRANQSSNSSLMHHFNPEGYSNSKRNNIFLNNPSYNLSSRLINDESRHHSVTKNSDYKFIEKIREDKLKLPTIKVKHFWTLSDEAMYVFISFMSDQYNDMIKANISLGNKICLTFNNIWESTIKSFCKNYNSVIELQEFYFKQTELKLKKGKNKCK